MAVVIVIAIDGPDRRREWPTGPKTLKLDRCRIEITDREHGHGGKVTGPVGGLVQRALVTMDIANDEQAALHRLQHRCAPRAAIGGRYFPSRPPAVSTTDVTFSNEPLVTSGQPRSRRKHPHLLGAARRLGGRHVQGGAGRVGARH